LGELVVGESAAVARKARRVLIVDDDYHLAEAFQLLMEDVGFVVETAHSGREALFKANAASFNLVVTDFLLPDVCGDDLSRLLKEVNPGVSIVMLTGASSKKKGGAKRDLEEELHKPVVVLELLRNSNNYRNL